MSEAEHQLTPWGWISTCHSCKQYRQKSDIFSPRWISSWFQRCILTPYHCNDSYQTFIMVLMWVNSGLKSRRQIIRLITQITTYGFVFFMGRLFRKKHRWPATWMDLQETYVQAWTKIYEMQIFVANTLKMLWFPFMAHGPHWPWTWCIIEPTLTNSWSVSMPEAMCHVDLLCGILTWTLNEIRVNLST